MDRALKLLIVPSVLGFLVAAVLGLLLAELWQAAAIGVEALNGAVYDRAMEDRVYHDRIMEAVSGATDAMLLVVAGIVWVFATGWFLSCWRTPVAEVGAVRGLRSRWGMDLPAGVARRSCGGRLRRRTGLATRDADRAAAAAVHLPLPGAVLHGDLLRGGRSRHPPGLPCGHSVEQMAIVVNLILGLGGTGAKVVESFVHLCASGLGPPPGRGGLHRPGPVERQYVAGSHHARPVRRGARGVADGGRRAPRAGLQPAPHQTRSPPRRRRPRRLPLGAAERERCEPRRPHQLQPDAPRELPGIGARALPRRARVAHASERGLSGTAPRRVGGPANAAGGRWVLAFPRRGSAQRQGGSKGLSLRLGVRGHRRRRPSHAGSAAAPSGGRGTTTVAYGRGADAAVLHIRAAGGPGGERRRRSRTAAAVTVRPAVLP